MTNLVILIPSISKYFLIAFKIYPKIFDLIVSQCTIFLFSQTFILFNTSLYLSPYFMCIPPFYYSKNFIIQKFLCMDL